MVWTCLTYNRKSQRQISSRVQLIEHYAMNKYGGVDVYIQVFLTSALVGGECQIDALAALAPRKAPLLLIEWRLGGPRSRSEHC
jgi:hypothetical protein